jgi:hypothetical protein
MFGELSDASMIEERVRPILDSKLAGARDSVFRFAILRCLRERKGLRHLSSDTVRALLLDWMRETLGLVSLTEYVKERHRRKQTKGGGE